MGEYANVLMKWLFIPIVNIVHSTYARWAKQNERKGTGERQKRSMLRGQIDF